MPFQNPLLTTTKFSELEVNVRFGIRLQSYTVTNTELYNYDIYKSCKIYEVSYHWRLNDLQKDRPNLHYIVYCCPPPITITS